MKITTELAEWIANPSYQNLNPAHSVGISNSSYYFMSRILLELPQERELEQQYMRPEPERQSYYSSSCTYQYDLILLLQLAKWYQRGSSLNRTSALMSISCVYNHTNTTEQRIRQHSTRQLRKRRLAMIGPLLRVAKSTGSAKLRSEQGETSILTRTEASSSTVTTGR